MGSKYQLAKILKEARVKAKITQMEVAERAEIHVNYYARIERGEVIPRIDIFDKIAEDLKIILNLPMK